MKIAAAASSRCPTCNLPAGQMTTSGGCVIYFAIYDKKRTAKDNCAMCGRTENKK